MAGDYAASVAMLHRTGEATVTPAVDDRLDVVVELADGRPQPAGT